VVADRGGTGLSMLLRGLKHYLARRRQETDRHPIGDLAAIVTVTDDGGSSGRLRRELPRPSSRRYPQLHGRAVAG